MGMRMAVRPLDSVRSVLDATLGARGDSTLQRLHTALGRLVRASQTTQAVYASDTINATVDPTAAATTLPTCDTPPYETTQAAAAVGASTEGARHGRGWYSPVLPTPTGLRESYLRQPWLVTLD